MTTRNLATCPQTQHQITDQYFMEHRAKLIDVAAFLDRVDRGQPTQSDDFRLLAFQQALQILSSKQPERVRRILELFSDATDRIPQSAEGMKGASGCVPLTNGENR